jgi:ribonuclease J
MEPTTNTENTKPAPLTPPAIPPSRGVTYRRFDNKRDNFRSGGDRRDGFRGGERRDGRSFNRDNQNNRPFNKQPEKKENLGNPEPGVVRIIPLGGVEEIGRNMTVIETTNDMVVIDMGFAFQDESTPGVDYLLPNTAYIEARKHKVRAVIITHAHLDHIGAIPQLFHSYQIDQKYMI